MADSVFSRFPTPPAAALLGAEVISEDPETGALEMAFHPDERFLNPRGVVQGGFVAAMLDDTMGPTLLVLSDGRQIASTIDLTVSFLRPVLPGRVTTKGRVIRKGRGVAFLEAELFDDQGRLCARATSSAVPVDM